MVFACVPECRCCQKFGRTGDPWHCKDCWFQFHNGEKDGDWEDEETFRRTHGKILDHMKEKIEEVMKIREGTVWHQR